MIFAWFLARPYWLRIAIPALACIALMVAVAWLRGREEADDTHNQQIGAQVEQAKTTTAALDNVRKADHAEEAIRSDPVARDAGCLRHSRTPANCH